MYGYCIIPILWYFRNGKLQELQKDHYLLRVCVEYIKVKDEAQGTFEGGKTILMDSWSVSHKPWYDLGQNPESAT